MTAIAADAMPAALFKASDICEVEQQLGAAHSVYLKLQLDVRCTSNITTSQAAAVQVRWL
jgi:hypothetical protein